MNLRRVALAVDTLLAGISKTSGDGVLLTFLFHGLFENEVEATRGLLDPQQGITIEMFRSFIEHFHKRSYRFVSPDEILAGIPVTGKYVLITFDDGYYNNARAVPVLEEFSIPAVFFISSNHVRDGKAFWWDVLYREMQKRNRTGKEIGVATAQYKGLKTSEIEAALRDKYGGGAMRPVSDVDRPFRPRELREFARHTLVHLGNHTQDHAILTNYPPPERRAQIQNCQDSIEEMTGIRPRMIAYPNGNKSADVYEATREAGLAFGIGIRPGRNVLPLVPGSSDAMSLKRFTLRGDHSIDSQCRASRASVSLYRTLNDIRQRTKLVVN